MAQNSNGLVYKNVLAWRGSEKLYLNQRTCDVYFVFETNDGEIEKVPAHKCILSAISEAFDAMFFGPSKQNGDVKIVDSSAEAFKEFLQYFYRSTVRLTADNVAEVMNLAKQYMLNDCLNDCTDFCKETMALDDICSGYELAILFEQDDLKKYCEQKVSERPDEIFQSSSFLICKKNLLRHILQLDLDESVLFRGCMAWAKAACIQNGLDEENMENLRAELGDLWKAIRFGRMSTEDFYACHQSYKGLFSSDEFIEIIGKIAAKDFQPRSVPPTETPNENEIICNRGKNARIPSNAALHSEAIRESFRSNCSLILKGFKCEQYIYLRGAPFSPFNVKIRIGENADNKSYPGNLVHYQQLSVNNFTEFIELSSPVLIKPGVKYLIEVMDHQNQFQLYEFKEYSINLNQGAKIDFFESKGFIQSLRFIECRK